MSDDYNFDDKPTGTDASDSDPAAVVERTRKRTNALGVSAKSFSSVMTKAFTDATVGGKQFDDVLKSMALKLSGMAVSQAFKPVATALTKGLSGVLGDVFGTGTGGGGGGGGGVEDGGGRGNCCCQPPMMGGGAWPIGFPTTMPRMPAFKNLFPFASGGVIGAPSYFPMAGGLGLAGEAGPEAIVPLSRGPGGRLGVAMSGGGAPANVTVQIMTPDAAGFRRSESYLTGQIARAVARGQRGM
jgi:phage-related minor tail protein